MENNEVIFSPQVNLEMSQHFRGQIIRLHVRCEDTSYGRLDKQTEQIYTPTGQEQSETHCVLIKFSGKFRCKCVVCICNRSSQDLTFRLDKISVYLFIAGTLKYLSKG